MAIPAHGLAEGLPAENAQNHKESKPHVYPQPIIGAKEIETPAGKLE